MASPKTEVKASGGRGSLIFLALVIAAVVAAAWFWNARRSGTVSAQAGSAVKSTLHLETFVVNLSDPGQRSYLRAGIDLGLGRELGRNEEAPPVAKIRDAILGVLAEVKADDLLTEKGKSDLKAELLHALQQAVPEQKVEEVYFTELLVQR